MMMNIFSCFITGSSLLLTIVSSSFSFDGSRFNLARTGKADDVVVTFKLEASKRAAVKANGQRSCNWRLQSNEMSTN